MGLGDFVSNLFGSKNKASAASNYGAPPTDPNAYEYGGHPGGAAELAGAYGNTAQAAAVRQAPQTDYSGANYADMQGQYARQGQQGITDELGRRGLGQGTTVAEILGKQQTGAAISAQNSQAASARGAAGLALAQQGAANGIANATGQIAGATQANAAQERLNDLNAANAGYTNIRGGDAQAQAQRAQQSQFQTSADLQQTGLNDTHQLGYSQLENQVNTTQLASQQNKQAQNSANSLNAAGINAGVGAQNAATNNQNAYGLIGLGSTVAGAGAGALLPPPKAHGGHVQSNAPYLVGERGPEMVIPAHHARADGGYVANRGINPTIVGQNGPQLYAPPSDAYVIPAQETQALMSRPTSTWGTGEGVSEEDEDKAIRANQSRLAKEHAREEQQDDRNASSSPQAFASPLTVQHESDEARVTKADAYRANGVENPNSDAAAEDDRQEELSRRRLGQDRKNARKMSPGSLVTSTLGNVGKQASGMANPASHGSGGGYHPAGQYSANLIPVGGARADGGPIVPNALSNIGTQATQIGNASGGSHIPALMLGSRAPNYGDSNDSGVQLGAGGGISKQALLSSMTGRVGNVGEPGMVGGTGITGGAAMERTVGARANGGMMLACRGGREEGGPVYSHTANDPGDHLARRGATGDVVMGVSADKDEDEHVPSRARDAAEAIFAPHIFGSQIVGEWLARRGR